MQQIHVKRYNESKAVGYQGSIEPEDRSWVLFVRSDGEPSLFRRVEVSANPDGSNAEHLYVDVELPGVMADTVADAVVAALPDPSGPTPLDFTITQQDGVFWARLNCRAVACSGATEHEAIQALLNYVAKLCVAGCLDHTGRPMRWHSKRRYEAAFGPENGKADHVDALAEAPHA